MKIALGFCECTRFDAICQSVRKGGRFEVPKTMDLGLFQKIHVLCPYCILRLEAVVLAPSLMDCTHGATPVSRFWWHLEVPELVFWRFLPGLWTNERIPVDFLPLMVSRVRGDNPPFRTGFPPSAGQLLRLTRVVFVILCPMVLRVSTQWPCSLPSVSCHPQRGRTGVPLLIVIVFVWLYRFGLWSIGVSE